MCNKSLKANGCCAVPKKKKNQKDITDNSMEAEFARQPVHSLALESWESIHGVFIILNVVTQYLSIKKT